MALPGDSEARKRSDRRHDERAKRGTTRSGAGRQESEASRAGRRLVMSSSSVRHGRKVRYKVSIVTVWETTIFNIASFQFLSEATAIEQSRT